MLMGSAAMAGQVRFGANRMRRILPAISPRIVVKPPRPRIAAPFIAQPPVTASRIFIASSPVIDPSLNAGAAEMSSLETRRRISAVIAAIGLMAAMIEGGLVADPRQRGAQASERSLGFGEALALLLDDLGLRLGEELLVAELLHDLVPLAFEHRRLLGEPRTLLVEIDGAGEVERHRRVAGQHLDHAPRPEQAIARRRFGNVDRGEARKALDGLLMTF